MQNFYLIAALVLLLNSLSNSMVSAQPGNGSSDSNSHSQNQPDAQDIRNWFDQYDKIRRRAKMTWMEKLQSRHLLALAINPLAIFSSEATPLLQKMIDKYTTAIEELEQLPSIPETEELQKGYLQYFKDAKKLFTDTCEAQKEEPEKRSKILQPLMGKKKDLESLDQSNKRLDAKLRQQYHITPLW